MHESSPYLQLESYTNIKYTQISEVYSFGMFVYAIMTNKLPFDKIKNHEFMNNVEHQDPLLFIASNDKIPASYRELISRCCNNDRNLFY